MKKPLYRIGTQDLDTWFVDLETALKHVLECCSRWDAVLLLDEADVFLEKRSTQSLNRNNLVSGMSQIPYLPKMYKSKTMNSVSAALGVLRRNDDPDDKPPRNH